MEDYKPNSNRFKERQTELNAEKRIEKVILGSAKQKKRGNIQKFKEAFIQENIENVKSYILMDGIVPSVKKAVSDVVRNGIDIILYGEAERDKKSSKVSYRSFYERENPQKRDYSYSLSRNGFEYDNIIFDTRGDAEAVIDAMNDIISQYNMVSVGDLYELANVPNDNYTINKYGWTDISGCKPIRVREGYILKLPRALPLN